MHLLTSDRMKWGAAASGVGLILLGAQLLHGPLSAVRSRRMAMIPVHCQADVPQLFRESSIDPARLAVAVNQFVAIGEEASVNELVALAAKPRALSSDLPARIAWVCRILFIPKGPEPLRPPAYGALMLPRQSMPMDKWPLLPVAHSGQTYFVLSEAYSVWGRAERAEDYVLYCRENGTFLRSPIPVPTREQAMQDAATLRQADAWQAIQWPTDSATENDHFRREVIGRYIQAQAEAIPVEANGF
jgi:hypothetical protein